MHKVLDITNTSDALIGTGTTLTVTATDYNAIYTIVIYGDVVSNGKIDLNDLITVRNYLLEAGALNSVDQIAGDIYGEGGEE